MCRTLLTQRSETTKTAQQIVELSNKSENCAIERLTKSDEAAGFCEISNYYRLQLVARTDEKIDVDADVQGTVVQVLAPVNAILKLALDHMFSGQLLLLPNPFCFRLLLQDVVLSLLLFLRLVAFDAALSLEQIRVVRMEDVVNQRSNRLHRVVATLRNRLNHD